MAVKIGQMAIVINTTGAIQITSGATYVYAFSVAPFNATTSQEYIGSSTVTVTTGAAIPAFPSALPVSVSIKTERPYIDLSAYYLCSDTNGSKMRLSYLYDDGQ